VAAGGNYGVLNAIAKGTGGLYGGILSTILITHHGYSFGISIAGGMAIIAGLVIVPLKFSPPVWTANVSGARIQPGAEALPAE
jgi:OFA family oxalate/formate antiporter-like MFS transporter